MGCGSAVGCRRGVRPEGALDGAVAVGRACIREELRNGRVLFLLWKGLAGYLEYYKKRYLFGYSALQTTNPNVAISTYNHLLEKEYVSRDYRVPVREEYTCKPDAEQGEEGVLEDRKSTRLNSSHVAI